MKKTLYIISVLLLAAVGCTKEQGLPENSQNAAFPEGAVVSLPLRAEGASRKKAFALGALSGAVEPVGALITLLAAEALSPFMPYLLSLAAGAMIYVVVEEMLPEVSEGEHFDAGTILFAVGFTLMMVLDSAL